MADSLEAGSLTARLELDDEDFDSKLDDDKDKMQDFGDSADDLLSVAIKVDDDEVDKIDDAKSKLEDLQSSGDKPLEVKADTSEAESSLSNVEESLGAIQGMMETLGEIALFATAIESADELISKLNEATDAFGELQYASAGAGLKAGGGAGATQQVMDIARQLAPQVGRSPEDIAGVISTLQGYGTPLSSISASSLMPIMNLATLPGGTPELSAQLVDLTQKQYGQYSQSQITDMWSKGLESSNLSQSSMAGIMPTMGLAAKTGGIDLPDLISMYSTENQSRGVSESQITMALRTATNKLSSPLDPATLNDKGKLTGGSGLAKELQDEGVTLDAVSNKSDSFLQKLVNLDKAGADFGKIFGARQGQVLKDIADNASAVESFSHTLENSQGAAQSYADTMRDTLPEAERRFGESLGELQTQIGSDFAPLKMQLMEDGRSLVDAITQGVATGDFSGVLPALAVLWQDVLSYFQGIDYTQAGQILLQDLQNAWSYATGMFMASDYELTSPFTAIGNIIGPTLTHVFDTLANAGIDAFNTIGSAAYQTANAISNGIVGAVKDAIGAFAELAGSADTLTGGALSRTLGLTDTSITGSSEGSTVGSPSAIAAQQLTMQKGGTISGMGMPGLGETIGANVPLSEYPFEALQVVQNSDGSWTLTRGGAGSSSITTVKSSLNEAISSATNLGLPLMSKESSLPNSAWMRIASTGGEASYGPGGIDTSSAIQAAKKGLVLSEMYGGQPMQVAVTDPIKIDTTGIQAQGLGDTASWAWNGLTGTLGGVYNAIMNPSPDSLAGKRDTLYTPVDRDTGQTQTPDQTRQATQDTFMTLAQLEAGAELPGTVANTVLDTANKDSITQQDHGVKLSSIQQSNLKAGSTLESIDSHLGTIGANFQADANKSDTTNKSGSPIEATIKDYANGLQGGNLVWQNIPHLGESADTAADDVDVFKDGIFETSGSLDELNQHVASLGNSMDNAAQKTDAAASKYDASQNLLDGDIKKLMADCEDCALSDFAKAQEGAADSLFQQAYAGPTSNYAGFLAEESARGSIHPAVDALGEDYSQTSTTKPVDLDVGAANSKLVTLDDQITEQKKTPIEIDDSSAMATIDALDAAASAPMTKVVTVVTVGGGGGGGDYGPGNYGNLDNGDSNGFIPETNSSGWDTFPSYAVGDVFVPTPRLAMVGDQPGGEWIGSIDQAQARFGSKGGQISIDAPLNINAPVYGVDDLNAILTAHQEGIMRAVANATLGGL